MLTTTETPPASTSTAVTFRAGAHSMEKLDTLGIDDLCAMVESGITVHEIAERLDVNQSSIYRWMDRYEALAYRNRFTRAMKDSAEALLDRGMRVLETCDEKSGSAVNRARYIAMEWARRAGIRDPRYSEKQSVELSGPNGGPIQAQSVVHVFVPANGRDVVHEVDGETLDKDAL